MRKFRSKFYVMLCSKTSKTDVRIYNIFVISQEIQMEMKAFPFNNGSIWIMKLYLLKRIRWQRILTNFHKFVSGFSLSCVWFFLHLNVSFCELYECSKIAAISFIQSYMCVYTCFYIIYGLVWQQSASSCQMCLQTKTTRFKELKDNFCFQFVTNNIDLLATNSLQNW